MKEYRNFLTADLYIQTFLIGVPILAAGIGLLVGSFGGVIWGMIGLVFIGAWQLISALVLAIQFKDPLRLKYLIAVALYLGLAFTLANIANGPSRLVGLIWFIIPIAIALWYYAITYTEQRQVKAQSQTFWDMES